MHLWALSNPVLVFTVPTLPECPGASTWEPPVAALSSAPVHGSSLLGRAASAYISCYVSRTTEYFPSNRFMQTAHKSCALQPLDTNVPLLRHKPAFRFPFIPSDFFFNYCKVDLIAATPPISFHWPAPPSPSPPAPYPHGVF